MDNIFGRIWEDLISRVAGPMRFRLFLQPAIATIFAVRDGIRDARNGEPAHFWSLFIEPRRRSYRIRAGWKAVCRICMLAIAMDVIYQIIALRLIYIRYGYIDYCVRLSSRCLAPRP